MASDNATFVFDLDETLGEIIFAYLSSSPSDSSSSYFFGRPILANIAPIAPLLKEHVETVKNQDPTLLDSVLHTERMEAISDLKANGYKVGIYTDNHGPVADLLVSAIEERTGYKFDWVKTGNAAAGQTRQKNLFEIEELFYNGQPTRFIMYDDRPTELITCDSERHTVKHMSPRFNKHYDATQWAEKANIVMTSALLEKCDAYYAAEQKRWNAE